MAAFQYLALVEPVAPAAGEVITEDKWHQRWTDPVRQRIAPQLAVALIASGLAYVEAAPFAEAVTESRWHQPWSEPVRVKPRLPEGEQQFLALQPCPIVSIGWHNWLTEPIRPKPGLHAELQQTLAWQPAPSPFVATGWYAPLSEPARAKPRLPEGEQQFLSAQPWPDIRVGWFAPLAEPVRPRPPPFVPAAEQQFEPFDEDIIFVDRWFRWWSEPVRVRPALFVGGHQVLAFDPQPFPFLGGGGGWYLPDPSSSERPRRIGKKIAPREVAPKIEPPTFAGVLGAQQPAQLADVFGSAFAPRLDALAPPALDLWTPALRSAQPEGGPPPPTVIDAIADHVDALDAMEALHALDELEQEHKAQIVAVIVRMASSE